MPFQVLSWYPRIVLFPKFLDHDKCDHVVEIGKKKLHGSSLSLRKGETVEGTRDIRTRFYPPTHPHRPLFCAFTLKCRPHAQPMPGQRLQRILIGVIFSVGKGRGGQAAGIVCTLPASLNARCCMLLPAPAPS